MARSSPNRSFEITSTPRRREHKFESVQDAERYNERRITDLTKSGSPLALRLGRCDDENPCGMPICSVCARSFRQDWVQMVTRFLDEYPADESWSLATIYLDAIAPGHLPNVQLDRVHAALRKRLRRAGLTVAFGGTEASWKARQRRWILHVHLLCHDCPPEDPRWTVLRERLADHDAGNSVDARRWTKSPGAIAYVQKFHSYHRPAQRTGAKQARAYPLPPKRLAELALWLSALRFAELPFLLGVRRRGDRLEKILDVTKASPPSRSVRDARVDLKAPTRLRAYSASRPHP
jgi:hypothetical protein